MACKSGSVETAVKKTGAALAEVEHLNQEVRDNDGTNKALFYAQIDAHLSKAGINDAREIVYNSNVKTEYASEFSLDKIAAVVEAALKALATGTGAGTLATIISPDGIKAYSDLVNCVAEAAKSTSSSAASLSFSMTRLSPGVLAFLYAWSINLKNKDTFGTEAITTTVIYYRLMSSIEDANIQTAFGEAIADAGNLLNMKKLQASLTDELAKGNITIDDWMSKDKAFSAAIDVIRARLASYSTKAGKGVKGSKERILLPSKKDPKVQKIVQASIELLAKRKTKGYKAIVTKLKKRLKEGYY